MCVDGGKIEIRSVGMPWKENENRLSGAFPPRTRIMTLVVVDQRSTTTNTTTTKIVNEHFLRSPSLGPTIQRFIVFTLTYNRNVIRVFVCVHQFIYLLFLRTK